MKKTIWTFSLLLSCAILFQAHTLFLKLDTYFLKPNASASVSLLNGTFFESESVVTRDRMIDVSIVSPDNQRAHPDTSHWRDNGKMAVLDFQTSDAGTYVIGVSTSQSIIHLEAKDFNGYLKADGMFKILELRKKRNELEKAAAERYSKHVKAILQAGDTQTSSYSTELGYPVEIVPLQNPYSLKKGDSFGARILKNGKPLADQTVFASYEGFKSGEEGSGDALVETRSDKDGIIQFDLSETGRWYIQFVNMVPVVETDIDYESNWATLTFEIR